MSIVIARGHAFEDGPIVLMARVVDADGDAITSNDVGSVTYKVYKKCDGTLVVDSTSLTVGDVVFDTLQTPSIWTEDTTGYNFRHDPSALADPEQWYRFEYIVTIASVAVPVVFEVYTKGLLSS